MPRPHSLALGCWLLGVLTVGVPPAAAQPPKNPPPLRNIMVLTDWTGDQVRAEMRRMAEAVGVACGHCHVQGDFASDQKRPKLVARRMLQLTMALNAQSFASHTPAEGESRLGRVTCYTCHQGAERPPVSTGFEPLER